MHSDHFVEIMTLLNSIVRCFKDNLGKVHMNRIAQPVFVGQAIGSVTMNTIEADKA